MATGKTGRSGDPRGTGRAKAGAHDPSGAAAGAAAAAAAGELLRDVIAPKVADKLGEKLERHAVKLEKQAVKQERMRAKAARQAEQLEHLASHLTALDIWMRDAPMGRRPRFTREDIADAAVRVADAEGFAAVSMRRLAAELDAGTMTLYHYVRTKDELLALIMDTVMGEMVLDESEPLPDDWRVAVTLLATRSHDVLRRHPWILDIADDPAIGPNSVRHFDQSLQAVASLGVSLEEKVDIVTVVDEYVFGAALMERNNQADDAHDHEMIAYVLGLVETGDYPALNELADDVGLAPAWERIERHLRDSTRFERNLGRLLDGIGASLPDPSEGDRQTRS